MSMNRRTDREMCRYIVRYIDTQGWREIQRQINLEMEMDKSRKRKKKGRKRRGGRRSKGEGGEVLKQTNKTDKQTQKQTDSRYIKQSLNNSTQQIRKEKLKVIDEKLSKQFLFYRIISGFIVSFLLITPHLRSSKAIRYLYFYPFLHFYHLFILLDLFD